MASLLPLRIPKPISPIRAAVSSPPSTSPSADILEQQFGRKGIKFTDFNGNPTVELSVRNGSSLRLSLSDALVTSYRPKVYWRDDGFEEVLHTVGGSASKGGLGLVLNDVTKEGGQPWRPSQWAVKDVDSDSIDAVQVELSCTDKTSLEISYVISLYPLSMAAAVVVTNKGMKPVKLTSAILSHIRTKSRRGTAVRGLTGCSYSPYLPPISSFGLISGADAMEPEGRGSWKVEDNTFTILKERISRVYAAPPAERLKRIYNTPPSKYETIDQGSGLGFRVIRMGYEDIYLASPGSSSQKHGDDYFICTGPASMLVPLQVKPGEAWRGAQVIEHDNL
ncbi:NDH-dependent cyclic electron flow 1 [Wolffia australiana]